MRFIKVRKPHRRQFISTGSIRLLRMLWCHECYRNSVASLLASPGSIANDPQKKRDSMKRDLEANDAVIRDIREELGVRKIDASGQTTEEQLKAAWAYDCKHWPNEYHDDLLPTRPEN